MRARNLWHLLAHRLLLLLHEVIGPILLLLRDGITLLHASAGRHASTGRHRTRLQQIIRVRYRHILGNHIAVVLVDGIVAVAIGVDVDLVELVVDLRLEELLDLEAAVLGGQLLGEPKQELVFVAVRPLLQFLQRILQVLHRIVPQFQKELHHVVRVLLCVHLQSQRGQADFGFVNLGL